MSDPGHIDPRRARLAARWLTAVGAAMLVVAAIHLAITPILRRVILVNVLAPRELGIVEGPFLLNHVVVGILLIPLGLTTIYAAAALRAGAEWAWMVAVLNAVGMLGMPLALLAFTRVSSMNAPPFLVAASLVTLAAVSTVIVLWWARPRRAATGR